MLDIGLKLPISTYLTSILRPHWGDAVGIRRDLWRHKTRLPGLSYGVVCVILRLAILVQYRLVTDEQTNGRTDTRRQHIPR